MKGFTHLTSKICSIINSFSALKKYDVILQESRHFKKYIFLGLVSLILSSLLEGIGIGLIVVFLNKITQDGATETKTGIEFLNIWIFGSNLSTQNQLYRISSLLIIVAMVRCLLNYIGSIYVSWAKISVLDRVRRRIFEQLQAFHISYYYSVSSGDLVNTITTETRRLDGIFQSIVSTFVDVFPIPIYFFAVLILSWKLSIFSFSIMLFFAAGFFKLRSTVGKISYAITRANSQFATRVIEFVSGIFTVHAFASQDYEQKRFHSASQLIADTEKRIVKWSSLSTPVNEAAATIVSVIIVIIGFIGFSLPTSILISFLYSMQRLLRASNNLNKINILLGMLQGPIDNIRELLSTTGKPYLKDGKQTFTGLENSIEIIDVDFGYRNDELAIKGINLTINKGSLVALVGSSGSGKSTLASLILRLHDPLGGKILIDGKDIRLFEITSLRHYMAIVSQDTFIFNTSVRDNIAYGLDMVADADIVAAARAAHALTFIEDLPAGFDTNLGERGVQLSGGQKQRIAIARALLRDPEILILDEATSAMDTVTEKIIQDALMNLMKGKTVISIAHRLSTITQADLVVVLDKGSIIEIGDYNELIEKKGFLWKYHTMQFSQ